MNKKNKLLAKRSTPGGDVTNLPNKSVQLNQYTTFRPTAVTTNYSSSPLGNSSQTTVITLHPVNGNVSSSDALNDTLTGSQSEHANAPANINSSSSSTSTSSSSKKHLLTASADSTNNGGGNFSNSRTADASLKRDQLLKEWLKHDDEVELEIMTISQGNSGSRQQMSNTKSHNYQQQQQQQNSRLTNNSVITNGTNNNRATSRFSDYSCSSNVSASNLNNHNGSNGSNMNLFQTKERTNLIDPWTKRNPTIVAQNVLMKHRAELEQLAASRTTNNGSQVSNASTTTVGGDHGSLIYHGANHHHHQNTRKYLLPDNKYYKK
jgi:hypothetical protein